MSIEIIRVTEGDPLPKDTRFIQLLATEERMVGLGTNMKRIYTVLVERLSERADVWLARCELCGRDRSEAEGYRPGVGHRCGAVS